MESYPNTFGSKFVTLFPWSKKATNVSRLTFDIINASENETAIVNIEYDDDGFKKLETMMQLPKKVLNVKPNSYITHKFDTITIMTRLFEEKKIVIPVRARRIFISSNSPISIIQCIFITKKIGDCFTVIPVTMAGNHYSFSIGSSIFNGIVTAYFIPTHTDSHINITTVTKNGLERISRISRFKQGSMIYAYNNSISNSFTVHISASSPIIILLAMRTHLTKTSSETFACTMLVALPNKVYSEIALWDDFDVHFAPLQSSKNYQTQLLLSAPSQNCQPFTVATFRPNKTKLIDIKPNNISNDIAIKWNYRISDAIVGYASKFTFTLYHA
ncbi:unnamed protein product [Cercopithifilaria johnstoni]|uniref:Uncharacterized protein n=1 Tax=Cercopithifilaria johnstoni TaxID=2874296 RepID=A0A8J2LNU7_9BILA|nr:unnamed protein product [Cercopithifilaria johnstoni]